MSEKRADDPSALLKLLASQIELITQLTAIVLDHQAYVFALQAYAESQPGWNVLLWNELLTKYQTQGHEGFQRDAQKALDALAVALRDFEGPTQ